MIYDDNNENWKVNLTSFIQTWKSEKKVLKSDNSFVRIHLTKSPEMCHDEKIHEMTLILIISNDLRLLEVA